MKHLQSGNSIPPDQNVSDPAFSLRFIFIFLSSVSATYLFHVIFYHYAPFIWSLGRRLPLAEYTPWARRFAPENDGMELYVLYPMIFAIAISALALNKIFNRLDCESSWSRILLLVTGLAAISYFCTIGFNPPMPYIANGLSYLLFMGSVLFLISALSFIWKQNNKMASIILAILLVPACFISTQNIFFIDYGYIFSPAFRLVKGVSVQDIYFQYDHLLSLLAALWMKIGLPILKFKFMGQLSYFFLFLGSYFLAGRLFKRKIYALYLFIALVIVKIYGIKDDPVYLLQVSPLRLDMWLIPLSIIFFKGPSHWSLGLTLALLTIFHHSFGIIYVLSYMLFIFAIFIFSGDGKAVMSRLSMYYVNTAIIAVGFFAYNVFFGGHIPNVSFYYQKIGLGFLPMLKKSFYWYFPPILSAALILLLKNRKALDDRYFHAGVFLLILAAGNSLYFFGRSHEHNIINISAVLLFVLFLSFDLMDFELAKSAVSKIGRYIVPAISIMAILLFANFYSGRAVDRISRQYVSFIKCKFIGEERLPALDVSAVRNITGPSGKAVFLSSNDFFYYYEGGYIPEGYYGLLNAWIVKKDLVDFLNDRLMKGYYLVMPIDEAGDFTGLMRYLHFKNVKQEKSFIFITDRYF